MNLATQIEALLFYRGEPVAVSDLSSLLQKTPEEVASALMELTEALTERGIRLVEANGEVELRTAPDASLIIEQIRKEELSKDLGKAGTETISIILYQSPIARADIDYIRGVNSSFILRNLLIRGLIERIPNPKDERGYLYRPTMDLLSYMGVAKLEDLPDYAIVREKIATLREQKVESSENGGRT